MKILKFGGTSVGKPERMHSVAKLIHNEGQKIVVLSALSGTTNSLVKISQELHLGKKQEAKELIQTLYVHYEDFIEKLYTTEKGLEKGKQIIREHFDSIHKIAENTIFTIVEERILLAQGELLSTKMFHAYLVETGQNAVLLNALDFMRIDENHEPQLGYIKEHLREEITKYSEINLFIVQGYICRNPQGEVDNLKRGGSDYTASLLGTAISASEIQIWTDIDGMHNNDPRYVEGTFPVAELSFDEAAELAYFGAKILHPATIHPAQQHNIPVRLLNTMRPEAIGTTIKNDPKNPRSITSIAAKDGIIAIKIKSSRMLLAYGFLRQVFGIFEKYKTPIDMITTSEVAISLTIDDDTHLQEIIAELQRFGLVETDRDLSIVCIVGDFVAENQGAVAKVVDALKQFAIRMISYGGSKHNISLLVNSFDKKDALNLLNEKLF